MTEFIIGIIVALGAAAVCLLLGLWLGRKASKKPLEVQTTLITERVRAVGKLVGLEVYAKEIATAKKGIAWLPPALLSQARLAMIFHFEKQYFIDLRELRAEHIQEVGEKHFRLTLPKIRGELKVTGMTPYDVSDGRVLGLLDVIPMNAETQQELMRAAQENASSLFRENELRYTTEARASIQRHLSALLQLFDVRVELEWDEDRASAAAAMASVAAHLPIAGGR
jgi:hypothetical protein